MAEPTGTIEGTVEPEAGPGLPQMDFTTFPSQIFWLAVTFGLLFIVLSRIAVPRIANALGVRKEHIDGDLGAAERSRKEASDALAAYEAALASARARALQLADENRKRITDEIEKLKSDADARAQSAIADAEARIAAGRAKAANEVRAAATEAASAIVQRLIGVSVDAKEASAAVNASNKRG